MDFRLAYVLDSFFKVGHVTRKRETRNEYRSFKGKRLLRLPLGRWKFTAISKRIKIFR
jgi:hypothetical protein